MMNPVALQAFAENTREYNNGSPKDPLPVDPRTGKLATTFWDTAQKENAQERELDFGAIISGK